MNTFRPDINISSNMLFELVTVDGGSDPQSPAEAGPEGVRGVALNETSPMTLTGL